MEKEFTDLLERFGLPTLFCVWLMLMVQKRLDRQQSLIMKLTMVSLALAKAWDVDVDDALEEDESFDGGGEDSEDGDKE